MPSQTETLCLAILCLLRCFPIPLGLCVCVYACVCVCLCLHSSVFCACVCVCLYFLAQLVRSFSQKVIQRYIPIVDRLGQHMLENQEQASTCSHRIAIELPELS